MVRVETVAKLIVSTAVAAIFVLGMQPVYGQKRSLCYDHDKLVRSLERHADETKHGQGVVGGGKLSIELWRTYAGDTWTLLFIDTLGRACLIAIGESWVSTSSSTAKENP